LGMAALLNSVGLQFVNIYKSISFKCSLQVAHEPMSLQRMLVPFISVGSWLSFSEQLFLSLIAFQLKVPKNLVWKLGLTFPDVVHRLRHL